MSTRQQLYQLTRDLRHYLERQKRDGAVGFSSAPVVEQEAWSRRWKEHEQKRLAGIRDAIQNEKSSTLRTTSQARRPKIESHTMPSDRQVESTIDSPTEQKVDSALQPPEKAPPLWKTLGSRPQARFAAHSPNIDEPSGTQEKSALGLPEAVSQETRSDLGQPAKQAAGMQAGEQAKEDMSPEEKLAFLRQYLGDCRRCPLCETRKSIVFGDGHSEASLMFIGEAPGYHEDQQGLPFVGRAGKLLDKMIAAMGYARAEVYIANVNKCRPPNNRNPSAAEIEACSPFLHKQIEAIAPKAIVTLGLVATQNLLQTKQAMGALRGKWQDFRGFAVLPTYHPAYLLRNEEAKKVAWSDLQKVMSKLNALGG